MTSWIKFLHCTSQETSKKVATSIFCWYRKEKSVTIVWFATSVVYCPTEPSIEPRNTSASIASTAFVVRNFWINTNHCVSISKLKQRYSQKKKRIKLWLSNQHRSSYLFLSSSTQIWRATLRRLITACQILQQAAQQHTRSIRHQDSAIWLSALHQNIQRRQCYTEVQMWLRRSLKDSLRNTWA